MIYSNVSIVGGFSNYLLLILIMTGNFRLS